MFICKPLDYIKANFVRFIRTDNQVFPFSGVPDTILHDAGDRGSPTIPGGTLDRTEVPIRLHWRLLQNTQSSE